MEHHQRDESTETASSEQSIPGIWNFIEQLCFASHSLDNSDPIDRPIIIGSIAAIAELRIPVLRTEFNYWI